MILSCRARHREGKSPAKVTQLLRGGTEVQIQVCPPAHSALCWELGSMTETEAQAHSEPPKDRWHGGGATSMSCPRPTPHHHHAAQGLREGGDAHSLTSHPEPAGGAGLSTRVGDAERGPLPLLVNEVSLEHSHTPSHRFHETVNGRAE